MATLYQIVLSKPTFTDILLPVSSFSYRQTGEGLTGSMVVEGFDYSAEISAMFDGTLTLSQIVDGVSTEVLTASIERIDTYISTVSQKYTILFESGTFSQTAYASALQIDDLISFAALQDSSWSWRISENDPKLQVGCLVKYDGIDYYIGDMSVFYSADGFGFVTINEGTAP